MSNKRQMQNRVVIPDTSADIAALATIGMRVRKAVADGYSVPSNRYRGVNYSRDGYSSGSGSIGVGQNYTGGEPRFDREPLPSHLDQPPSLLAQGSTMDSTSSMSEWDMKHQSHQMPLQTLGMVSPNGKRKRDDYGNEYNDSARLSSSDKSIDNYYERKYGELKFDETF